MKRAILVLGAPRSGTSATAFVINRLGVDFGDPKRFVDSIRNKHNPIFFELQELNAINNEIFSFFNKNWADFDWRPLLQDFSEPVISRFESRIKEFMEVEFGLSDLIGLKDPRFCFTLPVWATVLERLGYKIDFVFTNRNPNAIFTSNKLVNKIYPSSRNFRITIESILASSYFLKNKSAVHINYEPLLHQTKKEVSMLCEKLRLEPSLIDYASSVVKQDLNHGLQSSDVLPFAHFESMFSSTTDLSIEYTKYREYAFALTFELDEQITSLNKTVVKRDGQITSLNQALTERDGQIANLNKVLAECNGQIQRLNLTIGEHTKHISSIEQRVLCLDSLLKDSQLELARILNSNSYKITQPFRWLRRQAHLIVHVYSLARQYLNQRGGIISGGPKLTTRTYEIFRHSGVKGLVARIKEYSRVSNQKSYTVETEFTEHNRPASIDTVKHSQTNAPPLDIIGDITSTDYRFWQSFQLPGDVDIVVCVHNALEDVRRCLSSVVRYSLPPCRIIIVDDGSRDDTREYLSQFARDQGAILLRNNSAMGYTFAANQGMRATTGDHIVLLNSDTIVTPGWIEKLVACAESDTQTGLVGPLSNTASWQSIPEIEDNGDWATNPLPTNLSVSRMGGLVAKYSSHSYPKIHFLNGFCLLIKRSVIDSIGYFDEETFGRGYGEENDYCLRAKKAGWDLAVADNAYVFHAQSKSYSDEKRKLLCEAAGRQLANKHGNEIIASGVEQCRWDKVLLSIRTNARVMLQREETIESGRLHWEGSRVLFVVPVMHAGGGSNVVFTEARAMMRMGVHVTIANLACHRAAFEHSYPDFDIPTIYVNSTTDISRIGQDFDVVVATANHSVQWIAPLAQAEQGPVLGYYIQDFEPYFFEPGTSSYDEALRSYSLVPGIRLFTKTEWNRNELFNMTGLEAAIVGPSYDSDIFHPRHQNWRHNISPINIVAMVRPSSPRRNPSGTMTLLSALKERFGSRLNISIFGAEPDGPELPSVANTMELTNYGQLRPGQTSLLLGQADIFVDMSFFQAMGLTAMEAMACGAAPVVPRAGGATAYARHQENALVVDTENFNEVLSSVSELINDTERLRTLQISAMNDVVQYHPESAAANILSYLFSEKDHI